MIPASPVRGCFFSLFIHILCELYANYMRKYGFLSDPLYDRFYLRQILIERLAFEAGRHYPLI